MSDNTQSTVVRKKFKMPDTIVIIIGVILLAWVMTLVIPAGKYDRVEKDFGGEMVKVVDVESFKWVEKTFVNPITIPVHMVNGFIADIDLLLVILFSGGAFHLIIKSGAVQSSIAMITKRYSKNTKIFIPILTLIFALICTSQAVNRFIAFAPVMVLIALSLGYDSIVGVSIVLLGGAVGFSTGTLNIGTTVLSQKIAGLPPYSGIEYRFVCFAVFLIVTCAYQMRYAAKIKSSPQLSPMYDLDQNNSMMGSGTSLEEFGSMNLRKWVILCIMVFGVLAIALGGIRLGWTTVEYAAVFIWMAVAVGFVNGDGPSKTAKGFVEGSAKMMSAFLIIGFARAIASILTEANIIDTIVYELGAMLQVIPVFLQGIAMFISNLIINMFITSGSGQASAVMPIMIPLADLIGMTRQTTILAYNFGDGFCNYVLPTSTALMGMLGAANVPYDRWMKFMWKLFLIWIAVGSIMMVGAQIINYGPF